MIMIIIIIITIKVVQSTLPTVVDGKTMFYAKGSEHQDYAVICMTGFSFILRKLVPILI